MHSFSGVPYSVYAREENERIRCAETSAPYTVDVDTARAENDRNRLAEEHARTLRLDCDRIIAVALNLLEIEALERSGDSDIYGFISRVAGIDVSRFTSRHDIRVYILARFASIRAGLSPIALR